MKKILIAISISFLMFIAAHFIMGVITNPKGFSIEKWEVIDSGFDKKLKELPCSFKFILESPSYIFISSEIPKTKDVRYLFIPQIDVSYLEVYANGNLVGSFGAEKTKTGRIWYQPLIYELPPGTERISLKMYGIFAIAIGAHTSVIGEEDIWRYELLSFLTLKLHLIGIGMVAALGLIMLIISLKMNYYQKRVYIYIGFSSLAAATWLLIQTPFWSMGSYIHMLITRKILIAMLYVAAALLVAGISRILGHDKFGKFLVYANALACLVQWTAPSAYYLKISGDYSAFLTILTTFYLFIKSIKFGSITITALVGFSTMVSVHDTLFTIMSFQKVKPLSIYGVISISLGFAYILVIEYENIVSKYEMSELDKVTDHLTGAFNRKYLKRLDIGALDALVFADLNDFKRINDEYGHDVGDEVLKKFVEVVKENLRQDDVIVRFGGDEFLIIMKRCPLSEAKSRMEKIREAFKNSHELKPTFSFGVTRFSGNLRDSMKLADEKMYKMKRNLKSSNK